MGCLKESPLWDETHKAEEMWINSETIDKWGFSNDVEAYRRLFEASTGKEMIAGGGITSKDMKKFQVGIKDLEKRLISPGLLSNKILKSFYIGVAKSWRNPVTEKFFETLRNANEFRNSHTQEMMAEYENVLGSLKLAILEGDGIDTGHLDSGNIGKPDFVNPKNLKDKMIPRDRFKKLNEYEQAVVAKIKNGEEVSMTDELRNLTDFLANEGMVFQDFMNLASSRNQKALEIKYRGLPQGKAYIRNLINNNMEKNRIKFKKTFDSIYWESNRNC